MGVGQRIIVSVYYSRFPGGEPNRYRYHLDDVLMEDGMTRFLGGLLLSVAVALCPAYAEEWKLDAEKSKIDFVGMKPDGAHKGGFKKFTTTVKADLVRRSRSRFLARLSWVREQPNCVLSSNWIAPSLE